jgi:hypothetical protein
VVRDAFPVAATLEGCEMKKAPEPEQDQGAFKNHEQQRDSKRPAEFLGTSNPRHLRAIHALRVSPRTRESLDHIAGCSNGPELVAELRRRGLDAPCDKVPCIDRDGFEVKRGVYHFTDTDRRKVRRWLTRRANGSNFPNSAEPRG